MTTLRPATVDDFLFVYASLCDLEETTLDRTAFRRVYTTNLADPTIRYVVAQIDNVPIGFASCHVQQLLHHAGPVGEIQELYVEPYHRSRGVGQQLVTYFLDLARREGWLHLEVTSNRRRQRTHAFYERLGFVPTSLKFIHR